MMQFLLFSIFLNSTFFIYMNHPLMMGFSLMIQTLLMTFMIGSMNLTFWFSYILFLIFLGGMLILFLYMTSLAANEMFKIKFKILNMISIIMMIFLMMNYLYYKSSINMKILNNDSLEMTNLMFFFKNEHLMLNKMMNFPINLINIMMIFYLFITLIAVVKISNIFKGPIRMKQ